MKAAGFRIDEGVAGMPTAFVATWGSGKPVIGVMGEFDALPGLSQDAVAERRPRVEGGPGHGCGHNLFGVASMAAAIAAKQQLESRRLPGTIRFYGTPAEEGGNGKVYMVRAGLFKDADVVLHWHPNDRNVASRTSTFAVISAKFRYKGVAAHAASAPDKGRSALDAVMIMTHAVDLLREHIPQESRLHYVITKGGVAPNVVPDATEVYMYARHPKITVLDGIWDRILKAAEAGALATGTTLETELVGSTPELLPNESLITLIDRNLREVGGVTYSADERAFAEALQKTFVAGTARPIDEAATVRTPDEPLTVGSTDAADVSWVVPSGWLLAATYVPGTPGHTWQATACTGGSVGRKGMMIAAKTLALTAMDLLT
ncbi:MAG TPA: amidohydrolase, partial [Pseudomonadales bacterium]|nr:amidohydrolase [Pseudomonadales bacterium]